MKREVKYVMPFYIRAVDLVKPCSVSDVSHHMSPVLRSLLLPSCCSGSDLHFYLTSSQEIM